MIPLRDDNPSGIFPWVTAAIIGLNTIVLAIEFLSSDLDGLFMRWAMVPAYMDFGDITTLYPFVTSMFLHGGFMHFLGNMWFLMIFGDNVEVKLGRPGFAAFYILSGITAGLVQYAFIPNEVIPCLGSSGAIAAIMGFYLVKYPHALVTTLIPFFGIVKIIRLPAQAILIYWIGIQLLSGTLTNALAMSSGVAWWAHIGGFLTGYIIAKIR